MQNENKFAHVIFFSYLCTRKWYDMQETTKIYYYFDEAGDPKILGRHGVNLIERGDASQYFMVGYLETSTPRTCSQALRDLHEKIRNDAYLAEVPSIASTNKAFHANKDCLEVRQEVFRLLKSLDIRFYCIIAKKEELKFRELFDLKDSNVYKYMVSHLLENRLNTADSIDCYFSTMGNIVRQDTMQEAINNAIDASQNTQENHAHIRVLIQRNSEEPLLQAADYLLWAVQRAFERGELRYYNFIKDKIELVYDVFENISYNATNPLNKTTIDPL